MNQPKYPHVDWQGLKRHLLWPRQSWADPTALAGARKRASALRELITNVDLPKLGRRGTIDLNKVDDILFKIAATADINKNGIFVRRRFVHALEAAQRQDT